MVDIIGSIIALVVVGILIYILERLMRKERQQMTEYRQNFINALNNIANAIKGIE